LDSALDSPAQTLARDLYLRPDIRAIGQSPFEQDFERQWPMVVLEWSDVKP
jgi:hypothetical protein